MTNLLQPHELEDCGQVLVPCHRRSSHYATNNFHVAKIERLVTSAYGAIERIKGQVKGNTKLCRSWNFFASRKSSSALPFPAMPQIDGCARQMNGLPFRLSTSMIFAWRKFERYGRRLAGFGETGRLICKAHGLEREEGELAIKGRERFADVGFIFASRKSSFPLPFPAIANLYNRQFDHINVFHQLTVGQLLAI